MRGYAICPECAEPHPAGRDCPCRGEPDLPHPSPPSTRPAAEDAPRRRRLAGVVALGVVGLGLTAVSLLALGYLAAT